MNNIMSWEECQIEHIRYVEIDEERIKSIIEMALLREKRAKNTSPISENISFIVEDYYEVIKELLVAYLLQNGIKSNNHQCLISYLFKKNPDLERDAILISQMSNFRNRLNYYGEKIPIGFYDKNKDEFGRLIELILGLLKRS